MRFGTDEICNKYLLNKMNEQKAINCEYMFLWTIANQKTNIEDKKKSDKRCLWGWGYSSVHKALILIHSTAKKLLNRCVSRHCQHRVFLLSALEVTWAIQVS
jgi:hypothetical protein